MARILVTGPPGFLLGHVVEALLRRGDEVRCFAPPTPPFQDWRKTEIDYIEAEWDDELRWKAALSGIDTVFHLAGLSSATDPAELFRINQVATPLLVQCCGDRETPPTLIVASTIAASGPVARGKSRTESEPAAPVSRFGVSHRWRELAAERGSDRVPVTIVRSGVLIGEGNRELLPLFRMISAFHLHAVPTFEPPALSLIHVSDLIEVLFRAECRGRRVGVDHSRGPGSGYYFGCIDEHPTLLEFGRLIGNALGVRRLVLFPIAEPFPWLMAGASQLWNSLRRRHHPFNLDKIREATAPSWSCSTEAIRNELDFVPTHTLADRLRQTAEWYRANGWLQATRRLTMVDEASAGQSLRQPSWSIT